MPSSPDSWLRLVRQAKPSAKPSAKRIGIAEWAYPRGGRYGSLSCDLETRSPIELLPDRAVQTVCTCLEQHPEVEVLSRDRWSESATAAQKGAPPAIQVADRWHRLTNLVEALTHLLVRHRSQVSLLAAKAEHGQAPTEARGAATSMAEHPPTTSALLVGPTGCATRCNV
jgi:transposase